MTGLILDHPLEFLLLSSVITDTITGHIAAIYCQKWDSKKASRGAMKHMAVLFTVFLLALPMSIYFNLMEGYVTYALYITGINVFSIAENLSLVGVDMGPLKKYFSRMKGDDDDES